MAVRQKNRYMGLEDLEVQAFGVRIGLRAYNAFLARTGIYINSFVGVISMLLMVVPMFQL